MHLFVAMCVVCVAPMVFEPEGPRFISRGPDYMIALEPGRATVVAKDMNLAWRYAGANAGQLEPLEPLPGTAEDSRDGDAEESRTAFARVRQQHLYEGVEAQYYGEGRRLEYDLILAPGADVSVIRLQFEKGRPRIDRDGALLIKTSAGLVRHDPPVSYQLIDGVGRIPVRSKYVRRKGGAIGFALGAYDPAYPVIIDPIVTVLPAGEDDNPR